MHFLVIVLGFFGIICFCHKKREYVACSDKNTKTKTSYRAVTFVERFIVSLLQQEDSCLLNLQKSTLCCHESEYVDAAWTKHISE